MVILTRLINMGLCVLLSATAVLELIGLPNFQTLVLAVYLFAFACILCCFETHISFIASLAASNFGFLYNAKGRALFLLFVGILCFSFGSILGYISGIAMIADSIFNFFVILKYPEVQNQQRKDLESSSRDFVRNNQGAIARQGVAFAQNNPQQAAAAARTASTFV
ncbi:hypothetical protein JKP88DRAFT_348871 [Tribonema minus]|uniref:Uncharacterized protein n=1 Tax=Tribonema minus TaxID=303371 RepID=A0A836CFZ2_9STRA|nr:hypothetical protein JKP88DRAFT_348871 [Tribonema minus]